MSFDVLDIDDLDRLAPHLDSSYLLTYASGCPTVWYLCESELGSIECPAERGNRDFHDLPLREFALGAYPTADLYAISFDVSAATVGEFNIGDCGSVGGFPDCGPSGEPSYLVVANPSEEFTFVDGLGAEAGRTSAAGTSNTRTWGEPFEIATKRRYLRNPLDDWLPVDGEGNTAGTVLFTADHLPEELRVDVHVSGFGPALNGHFGFVVLAYNILTYPSGNFMCVL